MQARPEPKEASPAAAGPSAGTAGPSSEPSGSRLVVEISDMDMLDSEALVSEDSAR